MIGSGSARNSTCLKTFNSSEKMRLMFLTGFKAN